MGSHLLRKTRTFLHSLQCQVTTQDARAFAITDNLNFLKIENFTQLDFGKDVTEENNRSNRMSYCQPIWPNSAIFQSNLANIFL